MSGRERFLSGRERFLSGRERFLSGRERFLSGRERFLSSRERFLSSRERFLRPSDSKAGHRGPTQFCWTSPWDNPSLVPKAIATGPQLGHQPRAVSFLINAVKATLVQYSRHSPPYPHPPHSYIDGGQSPGGRGALGKMTHSRFPVFYLVFLKIW